ncbi:MAG: iron-containing alcohol dehydrogenase [Treponema sp.]|uniref:iron-containing alcohol dehydrogenase n=1 Tax=Treponema sp. TaxID=166 RepID=UPI001B7435A7|nr:iron-containing alcohol dehydrogenase [Treponema sp.]MBP5402539.1 iron-containing alcohol dehydrogenase [Treponema sp.]MBR5933876.1 iron-containing alcohol dehydrogenase [Treponema sp.]
MADFIFKISPNIVLGSYTITRIGQYAKDLGSKFMLIIDPMLKEVGIADKILEPLNEHKVDYFIFDEISNGANTSTIDQALTLARQAHVHGIIAAGGSKTINIAKAVCSIFYEVHDLYEFVDGAAPTVAPLPLICIPTTMRDPFIFSSFTPVIDSRSNKNKLIKNKDAICKLVLFDPNLSLTLTENQTASMSIETLCLATESYISQKASFFSDMIVEKGTELLGYAIDGSPSLTITTPAEVLLTQGGCMASLASAMSSPGVASLLAQTINARYRISRSLVTSILFPYVIEDAAKFKADKIAKLSKILRAAPEEATQEEAVTAFAEYIRQKIAKNNLPARLKDLSINVDQLALCAEDGGELDLINTLPRSMTSDDLFDLLKLAF